MIVKRSATVMSAEAGPEGWDRQDREAVLAAVRYAEAHWGQRLTGMGRAEEDE
jgi:hypothetical protein